MKKTAGSLALALTFALVAGLAPALAQPAPGCPDAKSKQFNFWIGDWDVTSGGKTAGTNHIRPILDGCVLQESWTGASGSAGTSLNFYNPSTEKWQQFWVWRNGTTLELSGGYADGKMTLAGTSTQKDGTKVEQRITWYDNDDGSVRQHWEQSTDGGKTWTTAFDGHYEPQGKKKPKKE